MWKISHHYDWELLRQQFSWIQDMVGVPQDPIYHAEGDVAIHTQLVVKALTSLDEFKALSEQDRHILIAAALLHDVEKRSTTVIESDGSITSKGHAKKGEYTSRTLLYKEISTPYAIREQVAKLVRYHGLPLWALEKHNPAKAVIKASLEVNTQHLALLAQADVLGRICQDQDELNYRVELFRELCHEQNCYGHARTFTDHFSKYFYFEKADVLPSFQAYDDSKFEVILMSALPGSGKDTYIQQHLADWPMISLDDFRRKWKIKPTDKSGTGRVVQAAKEAAKAYMRKRTSFVWNATNLTRELRKMLIQFFRTYGARVRIIYLEAPYRELLAQNRNREHVVPEAVIERMIRKLEIPAPWEAHHVDYVVRS
ncbi:MAG: AAA family ATPase [Flammeovirgaceae bacterium]